MYYLPALFDTTESTDECIDHGLAQHRMATIVTMHARPTVVEIVVYYDEADVSMRQSCFYLLLRHACSGVGGKSDAFL